MKDKGSLGLPSEVMRWVLEYLISNPEAKDTAEGILEWWIPKGYPELGNEDVEKILDLLVLKGWLTARAVTQQEQIYGLNRKLIDQIKHYLNHRDDH